MQYDDIIIGAGYAGLSLGALLSKSGRKVCVLEAHLLPGGCAGFYKRANFHFDVGATTLSGLGMNMPLSRLCKILDISANANKLDVPMTINLVSGKKLFRYADQERWIQELERHFPNIDHRTLWTKLYQISDRAWDLLDSAEHFPPANLNDLIGLIKPKLLMNSDLSLYFVKSIESILPKDYISGELRQLIDEQLLISTQSYAHQVPILMGALGLTYPSDMYYPKGGITALAKQLEEVITSSGNKVHYCALVEKITSKLDVITSKGTFQATRVISTIPIWNLAKLNSKLTNWSKRKTENLPTTWSAVSVNMAIKPKQAIIPLYHQLHLKKPYSWSSSNSLFVSLSDPHDRSRAPEGWQTLTLSTHVNPKQFPTRGSNAYRELKIRIEDELLTLIKERFSGIQEIKHISVGTPHTFERYTRRDQGLVGGIPHSVNYPAWQWPTSKTPINNLYHLGDTSFPGQGIVGVVQGALNFYKKSSI